MSCDIRKYTADDEMVLTAFVGPEKERLSVQFTIESKYCCLLESEVWDLIETLLKRLQCKPGYEATGCELDEITFIRKERE